MSTYSYSTPPTNALKLQNIDDVLSGLPDNTSKLIAPIDVRSAVYTLWENIMFKPTSNSGGTEYIGIDRDDINKKILIGKKSFTGTPVLNSNLLNSTDVDVFFYNTKTASAGNDTTIAILAGTGSNYQSGALSSPYIRSRVVSNSPFTNTLDFDINNSSYYLNGLTGYGGNISIKSDKGNVLINGVRFPLYDDRLLPQDGDILKYKYVGGQPTVYWEEAVTASPTSLFSTGTVTIDGSPVLLNGLPIDFSYNVPTPTAIGGIPAGSTFSNVPVTEMIRRILYPYIAPEITTTLNTPLIEIGDTVTSDNLQVIFTIYKNATYSLVNPLVTNPNPNTWISPAGVPNLTTVANGLTTYIYRPIFFINGANQTNAVTFATSSFNVEISDSFPTTASSTASLYSVTPWYYGTATISATQNAGAFTINSILGTSSTYVPGKLTPTLQPPIFLPVTSSYNKTFNFSTLGLTVNNPNEGYFYFGYPIEFPELDSIIDANGFTMTPSWNSFTVSNMQSPHILPRWQNKTYRFYIFAGSTSSVVPVPSTAGAPPFYSGDIQFKFI